MSEEKSNEGRDLRREKVVVEGTEEIVFRTASGPKKCDSCDNPIDAGERYARVKWQPTDPTVGMVLRRLEFFHEECFRSEFID